MLLFLGALGLANRWASARSCLSYGASASSLALRARDARRVPMLAALKGSLDNVPSDYLWARAFRCAPPPTTAQRGVESAVQMAAFADSVRGGGPGGRAGRAAATAGGATGVGRSGASGVVYA